MVVLKANVVGDSIPFVSAPTKGETLRIWRALVAPRGDRRWDLFLRASGAAALVSIPIVQYVPNSVPLVFLALAGIPANGPLSPILPTMFEPLIMEVAKYRPALSVTLVALAVYMYMEFLNWHIYAWVLNWERLERFRENRWVRWGVTHFGKNPFATVVFFALTPLPFWVVRCLAILKRYPVSPFMAATAIGRFPRLFVYAWVGSAIAIPTLALVGVVVGGAAIAVGLRLARHQPLLADGIVQQAPDRRDPPPAPNNDRQSA